MTQMGLNWKKFKMLNIKKWINIIVVVIPCFSYGQKYEKDLVYDFFYRVIYEDSYEREIITDSLRALHIKDLNSGFGKKYEYSLQFPISREFSTQDSLISGNARILINNKLKGLATYENNQIVHSIELFKGKVIKECEFKDQKKHGECITYDKKGRVSIRQLYKDGVLIEELLFKKGKSN